MQVFDVPHSLHRGDSRFDEAVAVDLGLAASRHDGQGRAVGSAVALLGRLGLGGLGGFDEGFDLDGVGGEPRESVGEFDLLRVESALLVLEDLGLLVERGGDGVELLGGDLAVGLLLAHCVVWVVAGSSSGATDVGRLSR